MSICSCRMTVTGVVIYLIAGLDSMSRRLEHQDGSGLEVTLGRGPPHSICPDTGLTASSDTRTEWIS